LPQGKTNNVSRRRKDRIGRRSAADVLSSIEEEEAAGFLTRIIATLPPRQQEVLRLKFQNELSYQQIAEITKSTSNSVGVLIHTALKTLRERHREASKDFVPFDPRTT
jgi:RNA polymerase sigma factor (sigma-70 family)